MAWFPHEPIDAVTYCLLCSRVSKLAITGYKELSHSRTAQKTLSLIHENSRKWKLHLRKRWITQLEVQLQENPWQASSIYLWMISLEQVETNNACYEDLEKDFQVGPEDWNDVALTGPRIRWTQDSQNGPYIEVSQNKAIDELEEIPVERKTKEDLHCTPLVHTMYRTKRNDSVLGRIT